MVNLVILVSAQTAVESPLKGGLEPGLSPPRRAALYLTQRVSGT
jgi:hypothetical protein